MKASPMSENTMAYTFLGRELGARLTASELVLFGEPLVTGIGIIEDVGMYVVLYSTEPLSKDDTTKGVMMDEKSVVLGND
jgi:hypothetical protein